MDSIRQIVAKEAMDDSTVRIEGERAMRFKQTRNTAMGSPADEYEAYCSRLALTSSKTVVELAAGSEEFRELEKALKPYKLPLYDILVEPGSPAPQDRKSFSLSYQIVSDFDRLDDEWLEALIRDDEPALAELSWRKFQHTDAFKRTPCSRETYDMLKQASDDGVGGQYLKMMTLDDYYGWYVKSCQMIDAEGNPTPEALAKLELTVDTWLSLKPDQSAEEIKYWLFRNYSIHPLHRNPFESMVDQKMAETTPPAPHPVRRAPKA
jgi:hypothetical protein